MCLWCVPVFVCDLQIYDEINGEFQYLYEVLKVEINGCLLMRRGRNMQLQDEASKNGCMLFLWLNYRE